MQHDKSHTSLLIHYPADSKMCTKVKGLTTLLQSLAEENLFQNHHFYVKENHETASGEGYLA